MINDPPGTASRAHSKIQLLLDHLEIDLELASIYSDRHLVIKGVCTGFLVLFKIINGDILFF